MDAKIPDALQIRRGTEHDLVPINLIGRLASPGAGTYRVSRGDLADPMALNLVALAASDMLCGYIVSVLAADELDIHYLAVHPEFRRRNVARRLVQALLLEALARGGRSAHLEVRSKNRAAIGLYSKLGFSIRFLRKNYYADDGDDALVMSKKITKDL